MVRSDLWEKTSGTPSLTVHSGESHPACRQSSRISFKCLTRCAGDAAILNDGDESSTHKSSLYIPWLRKTKYLAVESLVQRRSDSAGTFCSPAVLAVCFLDDCLAVDIASLQESALHSVPADVINKSFRDIETTLPGPQQQGLLPVAQYAIVPKQGRSFLP